LTGSSGANTLNGGVGKDYFYGGSDNDTINALDYGGDVGGADGRVYCGAGYDTVYYDRGFDFPNWDCEKTIGLPIAAPLTNQVTSARASGRGVRTPALFMPSCPLSFRE
jgi:Ca2+-binding RTX toxin-like protein